MRTKSVAAVAAAKWGKAPRRGTCLRACFDALMARPCEIVYLRGRGGSVFAQLRDFYGMEIELFSDGGLKLTGKWHGAFFKDFRTGTIIHQRDL